MSDQDEASHGKYATMAVALCGKLGTCSKKTIKHWWKEDEEVEDKKAKVLTIEDKVKITISSGAYHSFISIQSDGIQVLVDYSNLSGRRRRRLGGKWEQTITDLFNKHFDP